MPIQVLTNIVLPETVIMAGIRGKNMRNNTRSMSSGGFASININWAKTLRQYEIGIKPMDVSQWQEIEGLHEATAGGALGFLMKDPKDQVAGGTDGKMRAILDNQEVGVLGFGYGVSTYQAFKVYESIGNLLAYDRKITRIDAATFKRGTNTLTVGTAPGNISVDIDTGKITFVPDASQSIVSITPGVTTTLEFANDTLINLFSVGGRVWIDGVDGVGDLLINDKSHEILAKDDVLFTLEIDLDTSGLVFDSTQPFLADGTARKYPQPNEALTWAGSFYIPVHFASDEIDWEMMVAGDYAGRLVAGPAVVLQEIRE
jgi:uncharacterized protein (TIGR02217 family)